MDILKKFAIGLLLVGNVLQAMEPSEMELSELRPNASYLFEPIIGNDHGPFEPIIDDVNPEIDAEEHLIKRISTQAKLHNAIVNSDSKSVVTALAKGANPNKLLPLETNGTINAYVPPLVHTTTMHPEKIQILVAYGANPNGRVYTRPRRIGKENFIPRPILHYLVVQFLQQTQYYGYFIRKYHSTTLHIQPKGSPEWYRKKSMLKAIKLCATIETLVECGTNIDNMESVKEKILNAYRKSPNFRVVAHPLGIVYHMLGAHCDKYSAFIDCINKSDAEGVAHFGNPDFANKADVFGRLPLSYAFGAFARVGERAGNIQDKEVIQQLLAHGAQVKHSYIKVAQKHILPLFLKGIECPVCLQSLEDLKDEKECALTPCCHNFICRDDLAKLKALRYTCPFCRQLLQ